MLDANGVFDTNLNSSGFPADGDYGNAFLRLTTKGGLAVGDYFEMDNEASENDSDTDLGSGGTLLLSDERFLGQNSGTSPSAPARIRISTSSTAPTWANSTRAATTFIRSLPGALPGGIWSMPGGLQQAMSTTARSDRPSSRSSSRTPSCRRRPWPRPSNSFGYPGATPSVSANQGSNGDRLGQREYQPRRAARLQCQNAGGALQHQPGLRRTRSIRQRQQVHHADDRQRKGVCRHDERRGSFRAIAREVVQWEMRRSRARRHPQRSCFSGEARDLPLDKCLAGKIPLGCPMSRRFCETWE